MAKKSDSGNVDKLRNSLRRVSDELDADIILYAGGIFSPGDSDLVDQVRAFRKRPNVLFLLTTSGGSPDVAYRIARCLQGAYSDGKFILFVDSFCKSAGTLIAIGADQIVMSITAELGPLDVQLAKPDALAEQTSGLTPTQAIHTLRKLSFESVEQIFLALRFKSGLQITTRTALDIATQMSTGLFSPIFEQIDPMRLGEISRAMLIASEYGERLARGNEKPDTISRLIREYPSHGFVIDREEVAELFHDVREPTANEAELASLLEPIVDKGLGEDAPLVQFTSVLIQEVEPPPTGENEDAPDTEQGEIHQSAGGDGKATAEKGREAKTATKRQRRSRARSKPEEKN